MILASVAMPILWTCNSASFKLNLHGRRIIYQDLVMRLQVTFMAGHSAEQGRLYMRKILLVAMILAPGAAFADPAPNPTSNQSCIAQATLAYKSSPASVASGNNGNGKAVSAQAQAGMRGDNVQALQSSPDCRGPSTTTMP